MIITEKAMVQLKALVTPESGLSEGIRISKGNSCCGPSYKIGIVKQPYPSDIIEKQSGLNIYLDFRFAEFQNEMTIDYNYDYFEINGIIDLPISECCKH
ncbi:MAG: iron-sulfur cluster biosynthesis family protein [bacterium]